LSGKRRTSPATAAVLAREFGPARVADRFHAIYERVRGGA
jgi:hypothetical protein